MDFETVIGLEVHVQLSTASKVFCGCGTLFGEAANTQTCPVCLGLPGSLPVLNKEAFRKAIKAALALNCEIAEITKFDRKHYFYPDLPKNFQISQFDMPFSRDGQLEIIIEEGIKRIGITRVHLEEDAGKLMHMADGDNSLVDFNRAGTPLLEIVSEPDMSSPEEAYAYLTELKAVMEYIEVSDCDMEKGSLRCDANISLRPRGTAGLGAKVEIKNMNSFKAVRAALQYEVNRQHDLLADGKTVVQETRLWDADGLYTTPMRGKEESHDYRYFPEPDLPLFEISRQMVADIRSGLPEMPARRRERFVSEYRLSEYDAGVLTQDKALADYFEEVLVDYNNPKMVANWLMGDILAYLSATNMTITEVKMTPQSLAKALKLQEDGVISGKIQKQILPVLLKEGKDPEAYVKEAGLAQISDEDELSRIVERVIAANPASVQSYREGKEKALGFLVGGVMKETRGKANPQLVNQLLKERLDTSNT
ncbi:MAG: Asp-tRNA(Asn)/Glu-tRNA(Gln) amidotransferase subunit GatB [Candidatus Omnitrophica bacterium]|nr:Asp-tRNA(Asn)/Glu-tRNA(Gln) amidotransferase subunit GatB [Candidatus Omnitrophota bacterium]